MDWAKFVKNFCGKILRKLIVRLKERRKKNSKEIRAITENLKTDFKVGGETV